jgi:formamidopyrimidine-DNA glycosylase
LGTVRLYASPEWERMSAGGRLGPDALTLTPADWAALCRKTRRAVKVALLDQKLVAGIGNLYASEILHVAAIHPTRPAESLTLREIRKLQAATTSVLEEAIRYEGSTLGDGTYRNALNQSGSYQNVHRVYQKHGLPCQRCRRSVIERSVQAQRSTFFCPRCQK